MQHNLETRKKMVAYRSAQQDSDSSCQNGQMDRITQVNETFELAA